MKKKAIVIGSGIGGLSIAARLLNNNYDVTIYEKNSTIGGKTNRISYKNFNFDLTASLIMFYKDYLEIFKYCNEDYRNYFKMIPLSPIYKVFYNDNSSCEINTSLFQLHTSLRTISKKKSEVSKYLEFISDNYNKYLDANDYFLNKNFLKKSIFFNPLELYKGIKLQPLCSASMNCNKYLSTPKLIDLILFQTMYIGISPYSKGSSIYNIIPAVSQTEGLFYILGGMYSYIKALESLIKNKGGEIITSAPVDEILFKDNKAVGIEVLGEKKLSDIVVCSSDYTYSIRNFINDKYLRNLAKPINDYDYSCSSFILYLGLDKKYPTLKVNNIYINNNFKNNLESPFYGYIPNEPSLYIYCPSSIDSTVCPTDKECLNITLRVPNLLYKNIKWNHDTIENSIKNILDILSSIHGLEDIEEHIIFKSFLTPNDIEKKYNTYAGSAFGLGHNLMQTNYFRPQCKIPNIENLYFTGASVHPGNGVSMVLKSSKICMEKILEDNH